MRDRTEDPYERLLREWEYRRSVVQLHYRAMLLQEPSGPNDLPRQRERYRELSARLSLALLSLRHASDQLQACERERWRARAPRA